MVLRRFSPTWVEQKILRIYATVHVLSERVSRTALNLTLMIQQGDKKFEFSNLVNVLTSMFF